MKEKMKRLLTLVLAMAMAAGLLQSSALAAELETEGNQEASITAYASQGAEIQLNGTWDYEKAFEVLSLVNKERKKENLSSLTMDETLLECAMQRAAECEVYFSHTRPNGTSCFTLMDERSVPYGTAGENIAMGKTSAADVVDGWMNSEGHRENILNENFTTIGIGCFYQEDGRLAWIQLFTDKTVAKAGEREASAGTATVEADTSLLGEASLELSKSTLTEGKTGTAQLEIENGAWSSASFYPSASSVTFSSSKPSVAKVNSSGKITAVASGTATITGKLKGDSAVSASAKVTVKEATVQLSKPAISKLTNTSDGIKITWKKVSGAEGYYIYRKSGNGDWKKVKTTASSAWTDQDKNNGTKYQYKLYAYKGKNKSSASAAKTIYRLSAPKISSLKGSASKKTITVKWQKNSKASGYQIQYATKSDFSNGKSTTVSKNSTVSKTISKLSKGKTYYVRVRSYKKSGDTKYYSGWSGSKKVKLASSSSTVYITETGSKYHANGCRYLDESKIAISLSEAKAQGYEPCSVCKPNS